MSWAFSTLSGLVGRTAELAHVSALLELIRSAGAQTLLVEGEAGIGKSALVGQIEAQARGLGFHLRAARADELDGRRAFGLIVDALGEAWLQRLTGEAREAVVGRDRHGALARGRRAAGDVEFHASEAAIETIERLCVDAPIALTLEDLHWADASSLYVLRRLVRHIAPLPLVVIGTLRLLPRSPELQDLVDDCGPACRLALGPLDREAIGQLVTMAVGAPPGPRLRAQMDLAGGNPLFVLELLDALGAEGALQAGHDETTRQPIVEMARAAALSPLRLTVLHRLRFIPPETLEMLGIAAVLGLRFRPLYLARLAGRPTADVVRTLGAALAAGLLSEAGDELVFRHELVREALYTDLAAALRSSLHREAARVLERAGAPASVRVGHLLRGAEQSDGETIAGLQQAARTLAQTAPSIAIELLERAVELAGPSSSDLIADLAVALLWAGRTDDGEAMCRRAMALTADPRRRTEMRLQLVESLLHRGQAPMVVEEVDRGLREAGADGPNGARLRAAAALARVFVGDLIAADEQARALAQEGGGPDEAPVRTRALGAQALVAEQRGRILEACDLAGRAAALADEADSREAHDTLPHLTQAMSLFDTDRFEDAAARLARSRERQESFGARSLLPIHHFVLAFTRFWAGAWDEAIVEIETGMALAVETGTGWRPAPCGIRAVIALARGDRAGAGEWLRAGETALAAGEAPYRIEWLGWTRALVQEAKGERPSLDWSARAIADPQPAAPLRPSVMLATIGPSLVRLALAAGRRDLAEAVHEALQQLAALNPGAGGIAAAHTMVHGLLSEQWTQVQAAAERYRDAGRPFEQAMAEEEAALLAARAGRRSDARARLAAALAAYGQLGAAGFAARAVRRAAKEGIRVRGARQAPRRPLSGWDALTATEQRVLRLIAERRSNPEIARALDISRRTVETHVSHLLMKVDLRSREELRAAAARRFGWQLRLEGAPPSE